ncbi:uncharacterized protein LACBIDRAFT_328742 [Laccaria bicolor S238N-H82]|uniref:Predicted protein n=1 Tax=Laccaria bicolor (strain S238N-H82 / ATCC MYA-4686) TaxID=486041 RepID=B0DFU8_LACBS|nr:uncharacterized protein LACBIDRAFT_328742 [Laccaria bicolor S238N-H82]EDR06406.1 predicted protein [Laccaria bicolor S238N-H82]|eukprot:XP_001882778.1 predicted protein [Laccaria bicolor S238N-H82]
MAPIPEEMIIAARDSVLNMVNDTTVFFVEFSYQPTLASRQYQTDMEIAWRRLHPLQQEIMMKKIVNRLTPKQFAVPTEGLHQENYTFTYVTWPLGHFDKWPRDASCCLGQVIPLGSSEDSSGLDKNEIMQQGRPSIEQVLILPPIPSLSQPLHTCRQIEKWWWPTPVLLGAIAMDPVVGTVHRVRAQGFGEDGSDKVGHHKRHVMTNVSLGVHSQCIEIAKTPTPTQTSSLGISEGPIQGLNLDG